MRTSERLAAGAVALMVAPAFLAFPALGVWWVVHVWPGLTTTQRLWLCLSLATLGFTAPYVFRKHFTVLWSGRTKKPSLFDEVLILAPLAVGAWSLTGNWAAALAILYPKLLFSFTRILDALTGRAEIVDARASTEPEDVQLSPVTRLAKWVNSRRRPSVGRQTITMGPRRAKSRRSRGR